MTASTREKLSAIVLAGGLGRRMDGLDKGLLQLNGVPLIQHVIDRIKPQVDDIVISANRNIGTYRDTGCAVIPDASSGFSGPLAGIAACLPHCLHDCVLVVACDMPELPHDLAERLEAHRGDRDIVIASTGGQPQLALILRRQLAASIDEHLALEQHSLMEWVRSQDSCTLEFAEDRCFLNVNRPQDLDMPRKH